MFRHAANAESEIVWNNIYNRKKVKMVFNTIPHAIFSNPQIASIGLTEDQARKKYDISIGKANYSDVAMGWSMMEQNGFAKVIIDKKTKELLGFHIIGPYASILICPTSVIRIPSIPPATNESISAPALPIPVL